jgi:DNA-binding PadR family transcriptional regulator
LENRVKFKIGEIEFEAEGSDDVVERERNVFLKTILPAAVEAIVRTRGGFAQTTQYIEESEELNLLAPAQTTLIDVIDTQSHVDLSRTSLASFLKNYGTLNDQDFALISAYYDEKKNSTNRFSSENIKQYYAEARRPEYSNISTLLTLLAKKGYIMDAPDSDGKNPKQYILTSDGLVYAESYQPKELNKEKKIVSRPKKARTKIESVYAKLSADDLKLGNYPVVKEQDSFKKQMMLILYIVSEENHGDAFSVSDVEYLMTDVFGLPATEKQVQGVFERHRIWFKKEPDPMNKKACKHKLLEGAKDFVRLIINGEIK